MLWWGMPFVNRQSLAQYIRIIKSVHGVILVFDYTNRISFENIDKRLQEIKGILEDDVVVVLSRNKIDIEKENWKVTSEEAKEYATKMNLMPFETFAKINTGINEGFNYIANKAYSTLENRIIKNNNIILKIEDKNKTNEKCVGKKDKKLEKLKEIC